MPDQTEAAQHEPQAAPDAIRLTSPYGFLDEDGNHRSWRAGAIVRNAADVAMLTGRGAPVVAA